MVRATIAILVALAASRSAAAGVTTVCYAGTTTITIDKKATKHRFVIERTSDPDASEIRQRGWSAQDPQKEVTTRLRVDAKAGTFEIVDAPHGATGSGTLKGKPWKWTASHVTLTAHLGASDMVSTGDATYAAKNMTMKQVLKNGTETVASETSEAVAFDCTQLDAKRAALSQLSASAEHHCYEGVAHQTDSKGTSDQAVIVQQTSEGKHIEIRQQLASMKSERLVLFTIDGSAISVEDPATPGSKGTGTLTGHPGAWTQYAWKRHVDGMKLDLDAEGTLGSERYTSRMTATSPGVVLKTAIDAKSFDCSKLPERKAALRGAATAR